MNAKQYTNRLINEKSPYLLQHAHNPVDWYPWGDEAFQKAKSEDKPIFLSIGYSTCHWCHVMERESFEDPKTAELLNRHFVPVKVDREERADIDAVYMNVCQALTGNGGWPLSIFMDADKKPFFAGTYFPKSDAYGMAGFPRVLSSISDAYENRRQEIREAQESILEAIRVSEGHTEMEIDPHVCDLAFEQMRRSFDTKYGGFRGAPKFPSPHGLIYLLRYSAARGSTAAADMAKFTLEQMYKGGIFDHVGFGFMRYSTDEKWLVPHFEKMLYDNALLLLAYAEAYQQSQDESFKKIAQTVATFVLREMKSPGGGFFSAIDADSEGEEGKFYLWTPAEVEQVLAERADALCRLYDITSDGNFEGKNIPNLIGKQIQQGLDADVQNDLAKLFEKRKERVHPFLDDKILTGWNGLMIAALAFAGEVFHQREYLEAARGAANFILQNLSTPDGGLYVRYRDGEAANDATSEDYAYLIWGLLELHMATSESGWLDEAQRLTGILHKQFWDEQGGGLYLYGSGSQEQIIRPKEVYDGAIPSANAVHVYNLIRLSQLTQSPDYLAKANKGIRCFMNEISRQPTAHLFSVLNILSLTSYACAGGQCEIPGQIVREE